MGNRFIFLYCLDTFLATIAGLLMLLARPRSLVWESKHHSSLENRHGEKESKGANGSNVRLMPRAREKEAQKDSSQPYRDPR